MEILKNKKKLQFDDGPMYDSYSAALLFYVPKPFIMDNIFSI